VPYFPLFINIADSVCTIIGGGQIAERRVKTLLEFGARPKIIARQSCAALHALAQSGIISLETRDYAGAGDIRGSALVFAATNDRACNMRIVHDAKENSIPVNTADNPDLCTFFFPALVRRGELVAGITTSGSCPSLSAQLRSELDAAWPIDLETKLEKLAHERKERIADKKSRETHK
jgi:siroheme synthase-like protein